MNGKVVKSRKRSFLGDGLKNQDVFYLGYTQSIHWRRTTDYMLVVFRDKRNVSVKAIVVQTPHLVAKNLSK